MISNVGLMWLWLWVVSVFSMWNSWTFGFLGKKIQFGYHKMGLGKFSLKQNWCFGHEFSYYRVRNIKTCTKCWYPGIPENHDYLGKRDIWNIHRYPGIPENHDYPEKGDIWETRGYPEMPENRDYPRKVGHFKIRPCSKTRFNVRSITTPWG